MYNVTVRIKTQHDVRSLAQQIASLIEQATGHPCSVSVIDNKIANDFRNKTKNEILENLGVQTK